MSVPDPKLRAFRQPFYLRPFSLLFYTLLVIVVAFGIALSEFEIITHAGRLGMFAMPITIFILSLLSYLNCIFNQSGAALMGLLAIVYGAFVVGAALWFAFPEQDRLEPLSTSLALNAAFLGYITSSSGRGRLKIGLQRMPDESLGIAINLNIRDTSEISAPASSTPQEPDQPL